MTQEAALNNIIAFHTAKAEHLRKRIAEIRPQLYNKLGPFVDCEGNTVIPALEQDAEMMITAHTRLADRARQTLASITNS